MNVQLILWPLAVLLHVQELTRLQTEAMSAIEARNVSQIGFYDCSSVSIGALMGMMECELSQLQRGVEFRPFQRGAQEDERD